eukprot:1433623-Amphidinium_carterae.1
MLDHAQGISPEAISPLRVLSNRVYHRLQNIIQEVMSPKEQGYRCLRSVHNQQLLEVVVSP